MKKLLFSNVAVTMLMAFTVSFTLSSCSEEIVEDKQENQETQEEDLDLPKDVTVFTTGGDETTRTSLDLNAYFYWTANDKIWVDVAEDGSYATSSDDMEMSSDKRLAKFIFAGKTMDKSPYELTYTGINATSGTSVTIAQDQSQAPNLPAKIGENGDCATAVATRNAKGQYVFTLQHKAHYLIFQPYKDSDIPKDWKLKNIEIISLDDENLCGTYDFDKDGLVASSVTDANTSVTIGTGSAAGVLLNDSKVSDNPAWYAVIAPATDGEHWLRIRYTVNPDAYINYDGNESTLVKGDIVITKDLKIASAANKVTKIAHKMTLDRVPTDEFYQWNAPKSYWFGVTNRPTRYLDSNTDDYPKTTSDQRYTTLTSAAPTGVSTPATNSPCSNLPDVNALTWYAMAGDARWDYEYPWRFDDDFDHIYTQGTWFLKWEHIVAENVVANPELASTTKADCPISFKGTVHVYTSPTDAVGVDRTYDGTDFRTTTFPSNTWFQPRFQSYKTNGRPKDVSRYFFLPANGHIDNGVLKVKGVIHGCYWSSTAVPGAKIAYIMETKNFSLYVRQDNGGPTDGRSALDWWE